MYLVWSHTPFFCEPQSAQLDTQSAPTTAFRTQTLTRDSFCRACHSISQAFMHPCVHQGHGSTRLQKLYYERCSKTQEMTCLKRVLGASEATMLSTSCQALKIDSFLSIPVGFNCHRRPLV